MAGLDNIPQQQQITIETAKINEELFKSIMDLNGQLNGMVSQFGQIYLRKKEITDELSRMDEILERAEDDFKATDLQLREIIEALDDEYPQGRINMQDGTIQYQPGAPTRKQLAEEQAKEAQQKQSEGFKVVKE
jgi:hypothetical protein